jgi:protoheme ferro-lyase
MSDPRWDDPRDYGAARQVEVVHQAVTRIVLAPVAFVARHAETLAHVLIAVALRDVRVH